MNPRRSDAQLARASKHLQYEYWMLVSVATSLASGIAGQGWLTNALLESFVIHFRALIDFFYPPSNPKPDDVLATDYFDDPGQWEQLRPPMSVALTRGKIRAHKEIAHLTYARLDVTPETKLWAFVELTNEIGALMERFVRTVPSQRLATESNRSM